MKLKKSLAIAGGVVNVIIIIVVTPAVVLTPRTNQFRAAFKKNCEKFPDQTQSCESLLSTFEEAYVGQDACNFPEDSYNEIFENNPFTHSCGKTMFWSKTKKLVHKFTEKNKDFIALGNTLLGYIMDDLTWCGKKGSKETFNQQCKTCKPNPVSSFWDKASAEFAEYACDDTTVMLNGQSKQPFNPESNFGRIEVKKLKYPKVKKLTVILVTKNNDASCDKDSLQELRKSLDPNIAYECQTKTESELLS